MANGPYTTYCAPRAFTRPGDAVETNQPRRTKGGECHAEGCVVRTREGKPFCPAHVARMDYVRQVIERVQSFEEEMKKLQRGGGVRLNGVLAQDILGLVEARGVLYTVHIANEYKLDATVVAKVFRALEKAGFVTLRREGPCLAAFPVKRAS